jgi:hypothetical protein
VEQENGAQSEIRHSQSKDAAEQKKRAEGGREKLYDTAQGRAEGSGFLLVAGERSDE